MHLINLVLNYFFTENMGYCFIIFSQPEVQATLRYPMYKWAIFDAWSGTKSYIFSER